MEWATWVLPPKKIASFQGHFDSNSVPSTEVPAGDGPAQDTSGATSGNSRSSINPWSGVWLQIASLTGTNSLFVAQGKPSMGASFSERTPSPSRALYGSGGKCTTLLVSPQGAPVPCNDAP